MGLGFVRSLPHREDAAVTSRRLGRRTEHSLPSARVTVKGSRRFTSSDRTAPAYGESRSDTCRSGHRTIASLFEGYSASVSHPSMSSIRMEPVRCSLVLAHRLQTIGTRKWHLLTGS